MPVLPSPAVPALRFSRPCSCPPRSIPLPRSRSCFLALAHPAFAPATRTRAPHARVQLLWIRVRVQFLWVRVLRSIPRDLRSSPLPGSASPFSSPASPGSWGRCASRSAGMFHVKHPYALERGRRMEPVPASALRRIVSLHMEENAPPMHDSSPSPLLPTWCFPPRLRRQAPIIVHSAHSLPPRFPAFCGRCRREPVRAERGGRPPPSAGALPDWRPPTGAASPTSSRTGARVPNPDPWPP